jgi:hypothetical protein
MSSIFDSNVHCEQLFSLLKNVEAAGWIFLMNTVSDAFESQLQQFSLIFKDYCSKNGVKYVAND